MSKPNSTFSLLPSTLLKPYPAMKDSGVEWLGEVPEHWEVRRLKQVFQRIIGGATPASGESSFWDGEVVWITPSDVSKRQRLTTSARTLTEGGLHACSAELAPSGSIIVTSRAPVGNVALAATELCTNQGCKSLITDGRVVDSEFAFVVMQTLKHELQSLATGTTFTEISTNKLGIVPFPLPSLPEQAAIVRFLDYVDRRIRRYIRAKQKLIKLLEEQKQAIIHRAVTRSLDPDVPLKPSGVEWLGPIPDHWRMWQLGHLGRFSKGNGGTKEDEVIEGVPCIRYGDLYTQHQFFIRQARSRVSAERASDYTPVRHGDILFAASGETIEEIGKSAVNLIESHVCCGGDVILLRPRIDVDARFMGYATDCWSAAWQKSCMGRGITVMHIYGSQLKYMRIALPPLPEQAAIAEYLDQATVDIETAIDRARREISLLREYRTRLIADVVTGKLDVRVAAAGLPEEPDDVGANNYSPLPMNNDDDMPDDLNAIPEEVEE